MSKFLSNFVLLSSVLIFLASFAIYTSYQKPASKKYERPGQPTQETRTTYKDESGQPKYAQGTCEADEECSPAGCSAQVCTNDPGLITTCEIKEDFPDKNIFSCGCIKTRCVWYKLDGNTLFRHIFWLAAPTLGLRLPYLYLN